MIRIIVILGGLLLFSSISFGQFNGGVDDGFAKKGSGPASVTGTALSSIYNGGPDDGFAKNQSSSSMSGQNLSALFQGGVDDGFAKNELPTTLNGTNLADLYGGGIDDGFDKQSGFFSLDGTDFGGIYAGGADDGFDKSISTFTLSGADLSALYQGGVDDGFDKQEGLFYLQNTLQILQPNSGDLFCQNDTLVVEWTGLDGGAMVDIALTDDGGQSATVLLTNVSTNQSPVSIPLAGAFGGDGYQVLLAESGAGTTQILSGSFTILETDTTYISTLTCDPQQVGIDQILTLTNSQGCDSLVITQTILDTILPVAICQTGLVGSLSRLGRFKPKVANLDGGSFDNCGIDTITVSPAVFFCEDLGMQNVTLTVTDINGLSSSCTVPILIVDDLAPEVRCPSPVTVVANPNTCDAVVNHGPIQFIDNCPGESLQQIAGLPNGATYPLGVTINTYVVTDAQGFTDTCSFTVTVTDPGDCGPAFLAGRKALEANGAKQAGDAMAVFPNPFKGSTTIAVDLKAAKDVQIDILDAQGQWVHQLHDGWLEQGQHTLDWEAAYGFAPGVYMARLRSSEGVLTQRVVLIQ